MDKQYQPTLTEVQDWVLKLYNTCEQTGCFLIQNVSGIRTSFRLYRYPDYQKTPAHGYLASYYQ